LRSGSQASLTESKVRRKLVLIATVLALALGITACKEKTTSEEASHAAHSVGMAVKGRARMLARPLTIRQRQPARLWKTRRRNSA